jgi:hypothetical protein
VGKITGFMEFKRQEEDHLDPAVRLKNYKEFTITLTNDQAKVQGLRHPVLQHRLPGQQPDPRLERPGLPRQLPLRRRESAFDE